MSLLSSYRKRTFVTYAEWPRKDLHWESSFTEGYLKRFIEPLLSPVAMIFLFFAQQAVLTMILSSGGWIPITGNPRVQVQVDHRVSLHAVFVICFKEVTSMNLSSNAWELTMSCWESFDQSKWVNPLEKSIDIYFG